MKRLYILRHAKSSWDQPELSDFQRPLNKRGRKTAPFMGDLMVVNGYTLDHILCSPAARAKETAKLVENSLDDDIEIAFNRGIYEASTNSLIHIVSELDEVIESAMIVGHNPGFEGLVHILTGRYERMPTATLAVVDLNIENWSEVEASVGRLANILRPKEQKQLQTKS